MTKFKFTIDGKEYELKKLNVGEWLELAKIYDELAMDDNTNVNYVKLRCKIVEILFGLTEEEILNLPAENVLPLYINGYNIFKDMLAAKLDEKKSEEEPQATES